MSSPHTPTSGSDDGGASDPSPWDAPPSAPQPSQPQFTPSPPQYVSPPMTAGQMQPGIQNYMLPSILATLFCFLPTGIAAIVYANQVNSKLSMGDIAGARDASEKAKLWSIITVAAGVVFFVVVLAASVGGY